MGCLPQAARKSECFVTRYANVRSSASPLPGGRPILSANPTKG
nr:MAG TPA: hypothetical protein [Caudoviricetes sp.]